MFKYTIDDDNEDGEKETDDGINLEFTLKNPINSTGSWTVHLVMNKQHSQIIT